MTNLQAIQSYALLNYPIGEGTYRIALINADLDADAAYTKGDQEAIELCVADLILVLISSANEISDDGYSVKMTDIPSLWRLRYYYRSRWGLPDDAPTEQPIIVNLSNQW